MSDSGARCGECRFWARSRESSQEGECLLAGGNMSIGSGAQPLMETKLGDQAGRPSWETKLGDQAGRPSWETKLGDQAGRPSWETRLGDQAGRPGWETRLGDQAGRPGWETRLDESKTRGVHVFDDSPVAILTTHGDFSCVHADPRGARTPRSCPGSSRSRPRASEGGNADGKRTGPAGRPTGAPRAKH